MLCGSDCFISLYDDQEQVISVGEAVSFNYFQHKANVIFDATVDPTKLTVQRGGYFLVSSTIDTDMPCQFTIFVNDVPDMSTVCGSNAGAVPFTTRFLMLLKAGDVLRWVNYTSAQGAVTKTINAGGKTPSINAQFLLFRIAPEANPCWACHDRCVKADVKKITV